MSRREFTPAALGLAIEIAFWLLPACLFLWGYVGVFGASAAAILPHIGIILSVAVACLGLRPLIEHRKAMRAPRLLYQALYASIFAMVLAYYVVVVIGLDNWGRVATWRMIEVYLRQWQHLSTVLNVPSALVPVAATVFVLLLFMVIQLMHARLQWPQPVARTTRLSIKSLLAIACTLPLAASALNVIGGKYAASAEPITLSVNPILATERTQSNRSEGADVYDRSEAAAADRYVPGTLEKPRNVVVIIGDALRGDRMSLFDYARPTTPYFDEKQENGDLAFASRAYSVCAESYCGLMSIARSKFVHQFSRSSLTLQAVLQRHGYRARYMLGGDHTNFYGLSEAYGSADYYWDGSMGAEYVNDDSTVVKQAAALPLWDGKPEYLQFHLMSTHGLGMRQEAFQRYTPARNYYSGLLGADTETRRVWAENFYDNGMLQFDATVQSLLSTLDERGYLEDAVVVVTGDHGELLGEGGFFGHAKSIHNQVLDIPLIIMRFGYEGPNLNSSGGASQIDIAPTVLYELGLPVPETWAGLPLQDAGRHPVLFFQQGQQLGLFDLRDPERTMKVWRNTPADDLQVAEVAGDNALRPVAPGTLATSLLADWELKLAPAANTIDTGQ